MTLTERCCRHQIRLAELTWRRERWEHRHRKPASYPPAHKLIAAALIAMRELDRISLPRVS